MKKYDMLKDSPGKSLFFFALPMILGNLFQQFYNMADSMIVGQCVGENALAAVGASYSLTTVFIMIAIGGGIGASVITSQYLGARAYGKMKVSVYTALISFAAVSVVLGVFGFIMGGRILVALRTPGNILEDAVLYLRIYFVGLPFLFMYNVLSSVFNALGNSKTPLYLLIFSSLLNILLDLFMVLVLHMEVAGVAVATVLAQGLSAVISFLLLMRTLRGFADVPERENLGGELPREHTEGKGTVGEHTEGKSIIDKYAEGKGTVDKYAEGKGTVGEYAEGKGTVGKYAEGKSIVGEHAEGKGTVGEHPAGGGIYSVRMLGRMIKIAIPSMLQQSIVSIGMLLVQSVVNGFGSLVLAGYTSGMRVESICIVPMIATGNAMSTFTAQNLGAGNPERVRKGYRMAYGIVIGFAVLILTVLSLFHTQIVSAFIKDGSSIKAFATGDEYLRFIRFFFVFIGVKAITDGVLKGAGDVVVFTLANLINLGIRVFVSFRFAGPWGVEAVWYAVPMGWATNYIISLLWFFTGRWSRKQVIR